jgi:hypothetical protein
MTQVSRPLIALLLGTVLFFAVWLVALKGGSSSSSSRGLGQYQPAIGAARTAVKVASGDAARAADASASAGARAATTTAAPTPNPAATTSASNAVAPKVAVHHLADAAQRLGVVDHALQRDKVIALLFYNPAAADDQAVKHELSFVPVHRGRVVKLTVPLAELGNYTVVTNQVLVGASPTLVVIDRHHQASTIIGFADRFEIAGRVSDALATS